VVGVVGPPPVGSATATMAVMVRRPGASTQPASRSPNTAKLGPVNTVRVSPSSAVHAFTDPAGERPAGR
jgi:hypothetical protein